MSEPRPKKLAADRLAAFEAAARKFIAVDPEALSHRQMREHIATFRDEYIAFLGPPHLSKEG